MPHRWPLQTTENLLFGALAANSRLHNVSDLQGHAIAFPFVVFADVSPCTFDVAKMSSNIVG